MLRTCLALILSLFAGAVAAQAPAPEPTPFEVQLEAHRDQFRWIDLADMRSIHANIRQALSEAGGCIDGDCPEFDCPAANGSLSRTGELFMRLTAMENTLAYMHELELAHLRNFHEEANLTEAEAAYQNEVLFWQGAIITQSAALIQTAFILSDLESLATAEGPVSTASALDEFLRDSISLHQDLNSFRAGASPRFRERTSDLAVTIDTLTTMKSDTENLVNAGAEGLRGNGLRAREQLVISLGRNIRNYALQQLAYRQDEVARLNADAFRERSEANEFAERLRGLGLQRELAGRMAEDAFDLYLTLAGCVQSNCAITPTPLPEAPRVLRPAEASSPVDMPRVDQAALAVNNDRILLIGNALSPDWLRPQCEMPPRDPLHTVPRDPAPLNSGTTASEQDACQDLRNVGMCNLLTADRRADCEAGAERAVQACLAFPGIGARLAQAQPMTPAFNDGLAAMCRNTCDLQFGLDAHLDNQRLLAMDQIEELEQAHLENGGALAGEGDPEPDRRTTLEVRLRALRATAAARTTYVSYDPQADLYTAGASVPEGAILIAQYPGQMTPPERAEADRIREELDALLAPEADWSPRSAWGVEALRFWQDFGPHQFLMCGGETLQQRYDQCVAGCDAQGGAAAYAACVVPAPSMNMDLGPVLYPPDDVRSQEIPPFNAQEAIAASRQRR